MDARNVEADLSTSAKAMVDPPKRDAKAGRSDFAIQLSRRGELKRPTTGLAISTKSP